MGPWYLRDEKQPFRPGCSYATLLVMVQRGRVLPSTVMRGPTSGQFWREARHVPGVGHLFGRCHACEQGVSPDAAGCPRCGASFSAPRDRQDLGLGPVHQLPQPPLIRSLTTAPATSHGSANAASAEASRRATPPGSSGGRLVSGPLPTVVQAPGAPAEKGRAERATESAAGAAWAPVARVARPDPPDRRGPSPLALALAAASLLLALAVVVAAVFRTELVDLFGGGEASEPWTPPALVETSRHIGG